MCLEINWSVKTPWHKLSVEVARPGHRKFDGVGNNMRFLKLILLIFYNNQMYLPLSPTRNKVVGKKKKQRKYYDLILPIEK